MIRRMFIDLVFVVTCGFLILTSIAVIGLAQEPRTEVTRTVIVGPSPTISVSVAR